MSVREFRSIWKGAAGPARALAAAILAIGLADLASTVWLIHRGGAAEGNPLMSRWLAHGVACFISVKLLLLVGPLAFLLWAYQKRKALVSRALAVSLAGYLGIYALGVARVNAVPRYESLSLPAVTLREMTEERVRLRTRPLPAPARELSSAARYPSRALTL